MYKLEVENKYGERIELTNNKAYSITEITGLNPPNASINTSALASYDGSIFNSARATERNLVITVHINPNIEENRINLYKYFKVKQPTIIYYSNDSRDVYIEGYVESFECNQFENGEKAQISILCPRPFFKAVEQVITDFSSIEPKFEFEFETDESGIEFSTVEWSVRKSVINRGDVESGFIIELHALDTVVNPIIYNVDTRESFGLNITMQEADLIRINTNAGEKGVTLLRNGVTTNILNSVDKNVSWFKLNSGDNVFTYESESGYENLQMEMIVTTEYEGV